MRAVTNVVISARSWRWTTAWGLLHLSEMGDGSPKEPYST
jgi:hypothetical protein